SPLLLPGECGDEACKAEAGSVKAEGYNATYSCEMRSMVLEISSRNSCKMSRLLVLEVTCKPESTTFLLEPSPVVRGFWKEAMGDFSTNDLPFVVKLITKVGDGFSIPSPCNLTRIEVADCPGSTIPETSTTAVANNSPPSLAKPSAVGLFLRVNGRYT